MYRPLVSEGDSESAKDDSDSAERALPARRIRIRWSNILLVVLGSLIAYGLLLLNNFINPEPPRLTQAELKSEVSKIIAQGTPSAGPAVLAYEHIRPSLVQIQATSTGEDQSQERHYGTGFVFDTAGAILTSLHIVAKSTAIQVIFPDGTPSEARLVDSSEANDIAVLKPARLPEKLEPATLGNPRLLEVGDEAIVVGNPLGLTASLTNGTISALGRSFPLAGSAIPLEGLIQFDAAVNPGNSGGPLLNRDGEVVGIVTGLANPTGQDQFAGIGFAVPIDSAMKAAGSPTY